LVSPVPAGVFGETGAELLGPAVAGELDVVLPVEGVVLPLDVVAGVVDPLEVAETKPNFFASIPTLLVVGASPPGTALAALAPAADATPSDFGVIGEPSGRFSFSESAILA